MTMPPSTGYRDPGEGPLPPSSLFPKAITISIPFFGERLRIVRINGLSPRLRKCPNPRNIRYRFSDIGYPISRYKHSLLSSHVTRKNNEPIGKSPVSSPKSRSERAHPATGIIHAVNADNLPPIQTRTVP